ncbi:serine/threonine-protein kinase [Paraliomyxa miuraensis]|uniref:serine/threonine-protein kinase n=1 Tax=Paraliomyxa miuraensis TaxID=376150 RepID=UPI002251A76A|nr:serine/threonine-protein kinase [Paraliomyxa miuraensis]MCX4244871.1 serine/threonine-protein kinase [Paraliomyxa miuraensis]
MPPSDPETPGSATGVESIVRPGADETLADDDLCQPERSLLEPGARLDRYHVLEAVGRGGMGVVYAAYDADLDRKVALKVLHERDALADERAQQRLLREAQAMAKLSHPNVITVHEVKAVNGRVFVSMEFVEGGTLTTWLEHHRGDRPRVLAMFRDVGRGLAAAHAAGLVHRDVKPDNVLIGRDERPRVTDFGLARPMDDTSEPVVDADGRPLSGETRLLDATLTRAGALVGTPAYMSPEQFRREPPTAASDQYAFCVMLYEALWGTRPFKGRTLAELATRVLAGDMAEPDRDPAVPRWLRSVVMRGLSPRAEDRFDSMDALVERLEPGMRRARRRMWALAGLVLVGAGSLVGGTLLASVDPCAGGDRLVDELWTSGARAEVRRTLAEGATEYAEDTSTLVVERIDAYVGDWARGHRDACEAHHRGAQSDEALDLRGACLDERLRELRALVSVLEQPTPEVRQHAIEAVDDLSSLAPCADLPALRARVPPPRDPGVYERVVGLEDDRAQVQALSRAGRYRDGLQLSERVVEGARETGYPPLLARVLRERARMLVLLGHGEQAATELQEAWSLALAAGDDFLAAETAVELVDILGYMLLRYEQAELRSEDALAMLERVRRLDARFADELEARLWLARGRIELRHHRYADAVACFQRALPIAQKQAGPDSLRVAQILGALGTARTPQGQLDQALALGQRVLEIRSKHLGPSHPETAFAHNNVGLVLRLQRRYDEAIAAFERARALLTDALGAEASLVLMVEVNLAEAYYVVRRYADANRLYARAYGSLDPGQVVHEFALRRVVHYGNSLTQVGRFEDGRRMLEFARQRALAFDPPQPTLGIELGMTRVELGEGRPDRALTRLEALPPEIVGEGDDLNGEATLLRAEALARLDRRDEARALMPLFEVLEDLPNPPVPDEVDRVRALLEP